MNLENSQELKSNGKQEEEPRREGSQASGFEESRQNRWVETVTFCDSPYRNGTPEREI